jgi:hypothetical protein
MASGLAAMIVVSSAAIGNMAGAEVEKAYWDCEFTAIQGRISLDDAAACNEIYEHLKEHKFGGQFDRFLAWWQENKTRELSSRATRGRFD